MKYDDSHDLMRIFESIVSRDPEMAASDEVAEGTTTSDGDDIEDRSTTKNTESAITARMQEKYKKVDPESLI